MEAQQPLAWQDIVGWLVAAILLVYTVLFIKHFTATLGREASEDGSISKDDLAAVHRVIMHAYIFTVLAFFLSIMPFVLFPINPGLMSYLERTPVGVLIACQDTSEPLVTACGHVDPAKPEDSPDPEKSTMQWVVNFGGRISKSACSTANLTCTTSDKQYVDVLEGGLVVPLYLIIVALMGAAVGLARRLPEYQKRGSPGYRNTHEKDPSVGDPPMSPAQVRESVVFQIMQFLTAPLVAVTSYALVQPNAWETVVLLGFASGFSTEAVLMLIRKWVDQIGKPKAPAESQKNGDTTTKTGDGKGDGNGAEDGKDAQDHSKDAEESKPGGGEPRGAPA